MFRMFAGCCLLAALAAPCIAQQPITELLWPDGAPAATGEAANDKPTLIVYLPTAEQATGTAVVVCPGGGYRHLAMDHEGHDLARWFNSFGVAALICDYRHRGKGYGHPAPLQDAQHAVRIARSRAARWQIEPDRIGIMGFSAGGHLASTVITHFDNGDPDSADEIARVSSRPNFAILCYPVIALGEPYTHLGSQRNLLGADADAALVEKFSSEKQVTPHTPPTFLWHTTEDKAVPAENSVQFYLALRKHEVPAELHIFEQGRHGLGLAQQTPGTDAWPELCRRWMIDQGFLKPASTDEASTDGASTAGASFRLDPASHRVGEASIERNPTTPLPDGTSDLAGMLEPIRAKHKVPALGAALIRDGRITAIGTVGVRRAGGREAVTIEDRFHLGSDTKAMTATLIATLVADGTLSWATTVGEVFGDRFPAMDLAWKEVMLEQLLHHRGGAPADLHTDGLWRRLWERKGTPRQQRLELVEGVITRLPTAPPGTKFLYSNAGYAIAAAMAEQITDRAWEELMHERVFAPLEITTAGFGAPGHANRTDQPLGHRASGTPVDPGPDADNPPAIAPAGAVHMSLADWARFAIAHLRGDPSNPSHTPDTRLISPEMYARLHTPIDNYAMGWLIAGRAWAQGARPRDRGIVLTHAGSNTMWYCVAWLAPERDLAVLVATNHGGSAAEKAVDAAATALIQRAEKGP